MSEIVSMVQITETLKLLEALVPKQIDHRGLSGLHAYVTTLKSENEDLEEQNEEKQELIDEYGNVGEGLGLDPSELQSEWDDLEDQIKKLKEAQSEMKEHLAQKFYNHYDEMNSDKLMIARIVGPNLENMIDHMMRENKKLKVELEEKDANWNDWMNQEFGDELYPISPSPEPEEFVKNVNKLWGENKKLKTLLDEVTGGGGEQLMKMFRKFKEENKKLKAEIDDAVENHFADLKLRETTHKEWDTLEQENKKLKEENENLELQVRQVKNFKIEEFIAAMD